MLDGIIYYLGAWLLFLLPQAVLGLPIVYLGRKKANWYRWECVSAILPFIVYYFTMLLVDMVNPALGPSFSSYVVELLMLGGIFPVLALMRILFSRKNNQYRLAITAIVVYCVFAIILGFVEISHSIYD